ncbi:hypothetical protein ACO0LF_15680 [Undibacterium sp. Di27W]|uniref:hypothetical protein n=1 Tax=Undibacterium sp. Di27W TaxID=3413036 RepID=UPI003BF3F3DA
MKLIFLLVCVLGLAYGSRLLQIAFWPKVQVRVLNSKEEVTGKDEGFTTGWLHAELEYWYQSQQYLVQWRGDLMRYRPLPDSLWMVVPPAKPEHPRFPIPIIQPLIVLAISLIGLVSQLPSIFPGIF